MTTRQARITKTFGVMIAAVVGVGAVVGWLIKAGPLPLAATLAAVVALFAAGCVATVPYWRSIDDAARDAHKTAWFWGGGFGLGGGLFAAMVIGGAQSPMARGALLAAGLGVAGYLIAWAGWWLARRPAAV